MKSISFAFAKGIPKAVLAEDINGTQHIEEKSAAISEGFTEWNIQLLSGEKYVVKIEGKGRISYGRSSSRSGADVRFYRNQATKHYDAVIPEVMSVFSNHVSIEKAPLSAEEKIAEERHEVEKAKWEKKRAAETMEAMAEAIIRRDYAKTEEEEDF